MAATYCLALVPVKSSNPMRFHHHVGSLNLPCRSSKVLSMSNSLNEDITNSNPVSVPQSRIPRSFGVQLLISPLAFWIATSFLILRQTWLKPDPQTYEKIEELKKEVKSMLCSAVTDPLKQLVFIDKIQRLGVAYHFEAEIENVLQHIYENTAHEDDDLDIVALRFRILRQAGHFVSPGVFSKFKDERGEFHASLRHDVQGLLNLYEASYLGCKEENILDEAISFSTQHLASLAGQLDVEITSQIRRALSLPLHKRISTFEAPFYMSVYRNSQGSTSDVLLQLAVLDYNALQLLHRTELDQLTRWWKELNVISKLPFQARDKLLEIYAVVAAIMPEPKYSTGRIFIVKHMALFNVIDDIFDVYGTISVLQPITDTLLRWDVKDTNELPEFAKLVVAEIYNLFDEYEDTMATRGLGYTVTYFKTHVKYYMKCVLDEAKLFLSKRVPTLEEWLQISSITIGLIFINICFLLTQWDLVTKEATEWSISETKINHDSAHCGRIINDIRSFKLEQERGNMASSVTCYMKEHGVQEHEAIENLKKLVDEKWKEMNHEFLNRTSMLPPRLLMIPIKTIRFFEFVYLCGDGYTNPGDHVKQMIASLLVYPVPT